MKFVSTQADLLFTAICGCLFAFPAQLYAKNGANPDPLANIATSSSNFPTLLDPTITPGSGSKTGGDNIPPPPPPPVDSPGPAAVGNGKDFFQNTSMLTNTNYSPSGVPTNTDDVRITRTSANLTITAGAISAESLNVTNSNTYTISNATGTAMDSNLTLGNSAGFTNSFSGVDNDLIYLLNSSSLTIQGPNSGSGAGVLNVVLASSGNFSVGAGATLNISSTISGSGVNLTKTGAGIATFSGANTYSGTTTIATNGGTLKIDSAGSTTARLAGTTNITINSNGTLLMANSSGTTSNDRINNAATMTLAGGTFNTGGLSEHGASNNTAGIGALTLTASSIIDMGSGSSIIAFANSSAQTWTGTLSIYNWSGTPVTGNGADQLYFGSDATGLTQSQLGAVNFYSDNGVSLLGAAMILADGEIVPVPEPGTWFAGTLAVIGLAGKSCRRLRRPRSLVTP